MLLINFPVLETSASNTSECFKANSAKSISEKFIKNQINLSQNKLFNSKYMYSTSKDNR